MVPLQIAVLLLVTFARPSRAVYCICKDGASEEAMQNDIDYACGSGADCSDILPGGPCFQPNTVRDHCNYAVNSYFQRQAQAAGSCNFRGSATTSALVPSQLPGCVYQASPSSTIVTPPTTPSTGMTPTPGTPPTTIFNPGTPPPPPVMPGEGPTSVDSGATSMISGKGTLFVVLLIVARILG